MKWIVLTGLILAGCGTPANNEAIVWSGNITEQSERFIISYDHTKYPSQIERIENWWVDVQECAGVSVAISGIPLRIDYIDALEVRPGSIGLISPRQNVVMVILSDLGRGNGRVTKHEMLHNLIYRVEGESQFILSHDHQFFTSCRDIIHPW